MQFCANVRLMTHRTLINHTQRAYLLDPLNLSASAIRPGTGDASGKAGDPLWPLLCMLPLAENEVDVSSTADEFPLP